MLGKAGWITMEFEKFCPFIGGRCRDDCTFHCSPKTYSEGITVCLLTTKIDAINEAQKDQLSEISQEIES
jgi:hypothetical protein